MRRGLIRQRRRRRKADQTDSEVCARREARGDGWGGREGGRRTEGRNEGEGKLEGWGRVESWTTKRRRVSCIVRGWRRVAREVEKGGRSGRVRE